jgi:hypothetical protein
MDENPVFRALPGPGLYGASILPMRSIDFLSQPYGVSRWLVEVQRI